MAPGASKHLHLDSTPPAPFLQPRVAPRKATRETDRYPIQGGRPWQARSLRGPFCRGGNRPAAPCFWSRRSQADSSRFRRASAAWPHGGGASPSVSNVGESAPSLLGLPAQIPIGLTRCKGMLRSGDGRAARPKPRACVRNESREGGFAQPSAREGRGHPLPSRIRSPRAFLTPLDKSGGAYLWRREPCRARSMKKKSPQRPEENP